MEYPKLRPLEVFPVEVSGKEAICLRDPSNLTDKLVFVPYNVFQIIRFFDGRHSIPDIQVEHTKRYGGLILKEQVERIIKELDSHLLLESDSFHSFLKGLKEDFRNSRLRKAFLAGRGYEGTPERLRDQLEAYFLSEDGPGQATRTESVGKAKGAILPSATNLSICAWLAAPRPSLPGASSAAAGLFNPFSLYKISNCASLSFEVTTKSSPCFTNCRNICFLKLGGINSPVVSGVIFSLPSPLSPFGGNAALLSGKGGLFLALIIPSIPSGKAKSPINAPYCPSSVVGLKYSVIGAIAYRAASLSSANGPAFASKFKNLLVGVIAPIAVSSAPAVISNGPTLSIAGIAG